VAAVPGWPHADTADALRPHAEHGDGGDAHGTFLVEVDGLVVGDCGWFGPPDDSGVAEIGYGLAPSVRARGLGTEAVALLCDWVEQQPGVRRVAAEALVGNEPSRRLLARLGFAEEPAQPPYVRYVRDAAHVDGAN
jgi:ribosomal-protein-alanine N-acetyltransferase